MHITLLKSKIYRAAVTEACLDYEGSITIASDLMEAVGLVHYEKVLIANFRNGARFETYAIPGAAGSGMICINGAATHLARVGDEVIIMSFCSLAADEAKTHRPRIIRMDKDNRIRTPETARATA